MVRRFCGRVKVAVVYVGSDTSRLARFLLILDQDCGQKKLQMWQGILADHLDVRRNIL